MINTRAAKLISIFMCIIIISGLIALFISIIKDMDSVDIYETKHSHNGLVSDRGSMSNVPYNLHIEISYVSSDSSLSESQPNEKTISENASTEDASDDDIKESPYAPVLNYEPLKLYIDSLEEKPEIYYGADTCGRISKEGAYELKSLGYDFVCRYMTPFEYQKSLTKEEVTILSEAGLKILSVFELAAERPIEGAKAGAADGKLVYKLAQELGMPKNAIIYLAVDCYPMPDEYDEVITYFYEARKYTGEYDIGMYGAHYIVEFLAETGICDAYWQTFGASQGKISEHWNVFQYSVTQYDIGEHFPPVCRDLCLDMDAAGLWNYDLDSMRDEYYIHSQEK